MTVSDRPRRRRGAPFWESVDKTDECWLWTAALDAAGYGKYWIEGEHRLVMAHRRAYELTFGGPVEPGHELHHTCGVRACVRPNHLTPMPRKEHLQAHGDLVTHCPKGHEYSPENTYIRNQGNGRKQCRACHREEMRNARAR